MSTDTTGTIKRINADGQRVSYEGKTAVLHTTVDGKTVDETFASKSALFKHLFDAGMEVSEIATTCGSHYSFVYGAIKNSGRVIEGRKGASKSDEIRALADQKKTPGEISKLLNSNYSFVHSVVKAHRATQEQQAAAQ